MSTKKKKKRTGNVEAKKFLEGLVGALTFAKLIEAERLSEELTMAQFAKKLGISASHLNDIEKGRKVVSAERAAAFARKLGFSEAQYVRLALQDELNRVGLNKYQIAIKEAA